MPELRCSKEYVPALHRELQLKLISKRMKEGNLKKGITLFLLDSYAVR